MPGSGTTPSDGRKPYQSGGQANDLTYAAREAIHVLKEAGTGATLVLPQGLSKQAQAEINKLCAGLVQTSDRYTKDAQALSSGAWDKVSLSTKKELATLAIDIAKKHAAAPPAPPHGPKPSVPSLTSLTKGKGERLHIKVPVKFASHPDVHILLNYDRKQLFDGSVDGAAIMGGGIGMKLPLDLGSGFQKADIQAEVFIDTSKAKTSAGAFIKFEVKF